MDRIFQNTDKSIYSLQNHPLMLKCVAAQADKYEDAKKYIKRRDAVTAVFVILSIYTAWNGSDLMTAITCCASVWVLILNGYYNKKIIRTKEEGSAIQQFIDVQLYSTVTNTGDRQFWGELPSLDHIIESVAESEKSNVWNKYRNWYSDYSELPGDQQAYYCQRENLRWDAELRKKYITFEMFKWSFVLVAIAAGLLVNNPTLIRGICVLSWLSPVATFATDRFANLLQDKKRLQKLRKASDNIGKQLSLNSENTLEEIAHLQMELKKHREHAYLIPDWFYRCFHRSQQKKEDHIAQIRTEYHDKGGEYSGKENM